MNQDTNYKKLFTYLPDQSIDSVIETRVMIRIERSRVLHARIYFSLHTISILGAVGLFIPVAQSFATTATQGGLTSYISLIFTAGGMYAFDFWKDVSLSIAESFPVIDTIAILGLLLIIANALRRATKQLHSMPQPLASHDSLVTS